MKRDIINKLRGLCHPMAETLSDKTRIDAFCRIGDEAVFEMEEMQKKIRKLEEEVRKFHEKSAYRG